MSELATAFHASSAKGVFYVTGGGTSFLHDLLGTPGASRSVLEARVPYANNALSELLGGEPDQACSPETARSLAMAAFQRSLALTDESPAPLFGLGVTASLTTDRTKRGACRAHVALQTVSLSVCFSIALDSRDSRSVQESELNRLCWHALAQLTPLVIEQPRSFTSTTATAQAAWQELILGKVDAIATKTDPGRALFPGAFNPLHDGHRNMRAHAEQMLGEAVAYELCVANIEKPMLDFVSIQERLQQFDSAVWLTRLPRFLGKARQFPSAAFVVGVDTMTRIAEPKYYPPDHGLDEVIDELNELATRFIVFGRVDNGQFVTLDDLALPKRLRDLCTAVSERDFRSDLSSTALRSATQNG